MSFDQVVNKTRTVFHRHVHVELSDTEVRKAILAYVRAKVRLLDDDRVVLIFRDTVESLAATATLDIEEEGRA